MGYSGEMSPADYAAVTGNNNGGGFGNGDNAWWIIILFLFAFAGGWNGNGGFGGGSQGTTDNYVLASDFSQIERKLDGVYSGICDATFSLNNTITNGFAAAQNTMTQGFAGLNTGMIQQGYENRIATQGVQNALQSCCCDIREGISNVNYNMSQNANMLQSAIQTGFCQTNFNGQTNTRDIIDSQNASTRAILDAIESNKVEALKDRIAEQNQKINALQLSASQQAQNAYLIDQLGTKCPIPAYLTCNPNAPLNYSISYGGCGCNA